MASKEPELPEPDWEHFAQQVKKRYAEDVARKEKYRYTPGDILKIFVDGHEYSAAALNDDSRLIILGTDHSHIDLCGNDEFGEIRLWSIRTYDLSELDEGDFFTYEINKYGGFLLTVHSKRWDDACEDYTKDYAYELSLSYYHNQ